MPSISVHTSQCFLNQLPTFSGISVFALDRLFEEYAPVRQTSLSSPQKISAPETSTDDFARVIYALGEGDDQRSLAARSRTQSEHQVNTTATYLETWEALSSHENPFNRPPVPHSLVVEQHWELFQAINRRAPRRFQCPYCGNVYVRERALKAHLRTCKANGCTASYFSVKTSQTGDSAGFQDRDLHVVLKPYNEVAYNLAHRQIKFHLDSYKQNRPGKLLEFLESSRLARLLILIFGCSLIPGWVLILTLWSLPADEFHVGDGLPKIYTGVAWEHWQNKSDYCWGRLKDVLGECFPGLTSAFFAT
ncbi:hypothetical protein T265_09646 [Opisthorchis viverrini]|uniref:C2H2-type domain-containing protein n=1 Tax=Opisthorchis viverrini TaxID=6198 RepID=A0A074Z549_OPIVI|nr:hypothetical protein T265_09646 [Opisthorchis viverrini]KER22226.1 hypothetical protein T265_09646 [Opisthorchis viverrini]